MAPLPPSRDNDSSHRSDHADLRALQARWYEDLRRIAECLLRGERLGLGRTELANDAWKEQPLLRAILEKHATPENSGRILALMSRLVRRTLINRARAFRSLKRGGENAGNELPLFEEDVPAKVLDADPEIVTAVTHAMRRLSRREAQVVELKIFYKLSPAQVAASLGCSVSTVNREWNHAVPWLRRELRRRGLAEGYTRACGDAEG